MDGYEKAVAYFDLLDEVRELPGVEVDLVMTGVDLATGCERRSIRSAVERGSTIIGEVITVLSRRAVSYTHLRAHETVLDLVCRLLLEKKKQTDNDGR